MNQRKIGIALGNAFRVNTAEIVKTVAKIGFGAIAPSMPLTEEIFLTMKISCAPRENADF